MTTYAGSMRLIGDNLQASDGEIVSGTISTLQFFAFNFEYYAGEIQQLNWDGEYFQTLFSDSASGSFNLQHAAQTGAVNLVRGDSGTTWFENSEAYRATDIDLGGGDDRYSHLRFSVTPASIIDGGEGRDYFYAGRPGPVFVDVANEVFIDFNGTEHVVRNFEFFQGSHWHDTLIGAMDRSNSLFGDQGNDFLSGGNQNDHLSGGWGIDTIYSYDGDDRILGSSFDYVDGGDGIDTFYYRLVGPGVIYIDLENNADNAYDAYGTVLVSIENLGGSNWYDTMLGDAGDNVIETFGNRDVLHGRGGNDTLDGGEGDDDISGGEGTNLLIGGLGADTFMFETLNASDTITDFEVGTDVLDFGSVLSQADLVSLELNGAVIDRTSCFNSSALDDLYFSFVQSENGVEIFLNSGKTVGESDPLVTLTGVDILDLSVNDFVL